MYSLCAFGTKPAKGLVILAFVPVAKRYTHELYIFRYCTDIVYVMCFYSKTLCLVINIAVKERNPSIQNQQLISGNEGSMN